MIAGAPARRRAGFTLIEVLGAIFLTSLVLAVAIGFFLNLSDSSTRAVEAMRGGLHATAVLDRIARDLSGASLLVRPEADMDPNAHPWYFTAASHNAFGGSDALKFISRSQRPKVSAFHASDLAQVAYFTTVEEDGSVSLHRWTAPSLPPGYEPGFPGPDEPGSFLLAEGLGGVLFRFRTEDGEWLDEWDSKQLIQSDQLPTAVEVSVYALVDDPEDAAFEDEGPEWTRQIVLRQRPIDLAAMMQERLQAQQALAGGGDDGDADDDDVELDEDGNPIESDDEELAGMSVAECVQANLAECNAQFGAEQCLVWSNVNNLPVSGFGVVLPPGWGCQ